MWALGFNPASEWPKGIFHISYQSDTRTLGRLVSEGRNDIGVS